MLSLTLSPRFQETDALGHINNSVPAIWFEQAREPLFRVFTPDLDIRQWRLILAKYTIAFQAQLYYGQPVEITTAIKQIGRSSFTVWQEVWQRQLCVTGETVMVHFDYQGNQAKPLSRAHRNALEQWLLVE